jgi:uncharacterized protein
MFVSRSIFATFTLGLLVCLPLPRASGAESLGIRVLIVDGQNNHDWRATTPAMRKMLEEAGFSVAVATVPPEGPERERYAPSLDDYDVVLGNFTDIGGRPAPRRFFDNLAEWVAAGGGFVPVHAATAGMEHLPKYVRMVGLGWGSPQRGDRLVVDDAGQVIRTPPGEGRGTGHGSLSPIDVTLWAEHPVLEGLPRTWHLRDELWFAARGPAEQLTVLATGYSPQTEKNEPILWTVDYGEGRVFVKLLGHDTNTMQDSFFRTTLLRGCQWAATGEVTLPIPPDMVD